MGLEIYIVMKLEFITSINDYDLSKKEKVFGLILKHNYNCDIYSEKVKASANHFKAKKHLDSLALWRLTGQVLKPQDILN